ncbi:MAG: hypothetical protein JXA33_16140 [Anaerolineae bacterium]|nr:hypothetical protein [Anaerolineae bacterium]
MNEVHKEREEPRQPMGVWACLATGFEVVARRPYLSIPPLLLDLFLWLGPRLSLAPIFKDVTDILQEFFLLGDISSETEQLYVLMGALLNEAATRYNLFSMLVPAPLLGIPSLMAQRMPVIWPLARTRTEVEIASVFLVAFWSLVLVFAGLGLNALYLRLIGASVIMETESKLPGPETAMLLWWRLIQLLIGLALAVISVSMVSGLLVTLIGMFSPVIAGFVMTMISSLMLLVGFHFIFVIPAIVQLRHTPFQAIKESILLTRGDFLGSAGLVLLLLVTWRGLNVVWSLPDPASWSTLIGIGGHAFVVSGLIATLLVFYQERLDFLKQLQSLFTAKDPAAHPAGGE